MTKKLPQVSGTPPNLPQVFEGEIYKSVGKYARSAVLFAFEQMGGAKGLADWGEANQDEFYTKLFPKIIARESEVTHHKTVDQLMDVIDGDYVVDAEFDEDPTVMSLADPGRAVQSHIPVSMNWNATDYDFDNEEILEVASDTEESVSSFDMMDFED